MIDVIISHNNENKRWVIALANNLRQCGFSVWLDLLEENPGGMVETQWRQALGNSRRAVLLVTTQSLESAWLQEQYETLRARQFDNPDFRFIPVFFGTAAKAHWIKSPVEVDFFQTEPAGYRSAFRKLIEALGKQRSQEMIDLPASLEIPRLPILHLDDMSCRSTTPSEGNCVKHIFNILARNRTALLLGPSDYDKTPIQRAILAESRQRYGMANVFHFAAHGNVEASKAEYFAFLCDQMARSGKLHKPGEFEFLVENLVARGETVCLLMTGVEEGSAEGRRALSHALRNLSERYYDWLKIILFGGENLLELCYKEGALSPLRRAELVLMPEPTIDDLCHWDDQQSAVLNEAQAASLLRLTGGNMRQIQQCLKQQTIASLLKGSALVARLGDDIILRARFAAYRDLGYVQRVAALLQRDDLGRFEIWPIQAVLRHLYWDGLLVEHQGRLRWRSDGVRKIGREVLGI